MSHYLSVCLQCRQYRCSMSLGSRAECVPCRWRSTTNPSCGRAPCQGAQTPSVPSPQVPHQSPCSTSPLNKCPLHPVGVRPFTPQLSHQMLCHGQFACDTELSSREVVMCTVATRQTAVFISQHKLLGLVPTSRARYRHLGPGTDISGLVRTLGWQIMQGNTNVYFCDDAAKKQTLRSRVL